MRIKHLNIENFKRIEELDIELGTFDCLVGPNNSGKTTFLQALALFDFAIHLCISRRNGTFEIKSRNISPDEFYVLPVSSPLDLWTDKKTQGQRRHKLIRVSVEFDCGREVTASLDLNFNLYHFSIETNDSSLEWLESLSQFRAAYLPVFSTFLPQEERRTPAVIEDALVRGSVNSVIRNLLLDLKHQERQQALTDVLARSFPGLRDLGIAFDETSDRYIAVTYHEEDRPRELDIFSAGSGFQQFLYLFGFITLRQPNVILLDEPDVHLHGALQRSLLEELRRLVEDGKQVLFATHSRELISAMNPNEILSLDEDRPRRLAIVPELYDTLDRLGSMDQTQLPTIQAFRQVLLVEDQSDLEILSSFCSTLLGSALWAQVSRRLAVCFAHGNPRRQDVPRLRKQLQQMLSLEGRPLKMFVVADRDYYPDLDHMCAELPNDLIEWHVWRRTEIENYLLSLPAICRALGHVGQQMDIEEESLENEFERLLEASRNTANDRLVKAFQEYCRDWDPTTLSRKAREFLEAHWLEDQRLELADAKDEVLPGIKRWLQENGYGQFSDKRLASMLEPDDLPEEVHELARRLADFAGVTC